MPMKPFDTARQRREQRRRRPTFCCRTFCVSTSGAAPVTVIVSSSEPDLHVGIHGRGEPRGQHDALAPEGIEAGQTEGDHIGAGPQIDDVVPALAVGDDRADLLDQRRTGGSTVTPGSTARRVLDHAGDAARLLRPETVGSNKTAISTTRGADPPTPSDVSTSLVPLSWFNSIHRPCHGPDPEHSRGAYTATGPRKTNILPDRASSSELHQSLETHANVRHAGTARADVGNQEKYPWIGEFDGFHLYDHPVRRFYQEFKVARV